MDRFISKQRLFDDLIGVIVEIFCGKLFIERRVS